MVERNAFMRHLSQTGWWVASLFLFVSVWELAYALGMYHSASLPPPHIFLPDLPAQARHFDTAHLVVGEEFAGSNLAALLQTTGATVLRVIAGLSLGFILGVFTGLAICYFRIFGWLTLPIITLLAPISPFAWLPVAIFIAGVGNAAAIFLVFIAVYFIIVLATIAEISGGTSNFSERGPHNGRYTLSNVFSCSASGDLACPVHDIAPQPVRGMDGGVNRKVSRRWIGARSSDFTRPKHRQHEFGVPRPHRHWYRWSLI